jgi:hypothetical protein
LVRRKVMLKVFWRMHAAGRVLPRDNLYQLHTMSLILCCAVKRRYAVAILRVLKYRIGKLTRGRLHAAATTNLATTLKRISFESPVKRLRRKTDTYER